MSPLGQVIIESIITGAIGAAAALLTISFKAGSLVTDVAWIKGKIDRFEEKFITRKEAEYLLGKKKTNGHIGHDNW